jgi:hypothetical protein
MEQKKRKVEEGTEEKGVCKDKKEESIRKQKCLRYLRMCNDQKMISKNGVSPSDLRL